MFAHLYARRNKVFSLLIEKLHSDVCSSQTYHKKVNIFSQTDKEQTRSQENL